MSTIRFGLRTAQQTFRRSAFQSKAQFTQRKSASTVADAATDAASGAAKAGATSFWNSPVGPKTVHFWAPIMKWGLVLAGASDFMRPAKDLSISQNAALMATGAIWTRWCFVIKPRNVFLASVNFLLFCVGATQVTRILLYRQSQGESLGEGVEKLAKEQGKDLKLAAEKAGKAVTS